jgi:transposase InsO family protein
VAELAEQFELHPNQIIQFRQHAVENMAGLFAKDGAAKPSGPAEVDLKVLHAKITYIPMAKGFAFLVAVMDWASRKVLHWRLSNTMTTDFCTEALEEAIERYGRPDEHIYLHSYDSIDDLRAGLKTYFSFFNQDGPIKDLPDKHRMRSTSQTG